MNRRRSKSFLGAPILPPLVSKENGPSGGAATGAVFSSDAPRGDVASGSEDQRTRLHAFQEIILLSVLPTT